MSAVAEFRDPVNAKGFTQFENIVLFDVRLSVGARVVYGALKHFAWRNGGDTPAQPEFAEVLGISERSLRRHLGELTETGLVTMERRRSRPNLYLIEPLSCFYKSSLLSTYGSGQDGRIVQANMAETGPVNLAGEPTDDIEAIKAENARLMAEMRKNLGL